MAGASFTQTVANRVSGGLNTPHMPARFISSRRRSGCISLPAAPSPRRAARLSVHAFQFMKRLGVKKPAWLPDFGKDKRKALLEHFFASPISRQVR